MLDFQALFGCLSSYFRFWAR